jgi:hypothetical protein
MHRFYLYAHLNICILLDLHGASASIHTAKVPLRRKKKRRTNVQPQGRPRRKMSSDRRLHPSASAPIHTGHVKRQEKTPDALFDFLNTPMLFPLQPVATEVIVEISW